VPSWKVKAATQRCFSAMPGGHHLNFFFQQHVTHGLPISDAKLDEVVEIAADHVRALDAWSAIPVADGRCFEFGAGWDLHVAQTLCCLGVNHQTVVDIRPLLHQRLVLDIRDRLAAHARDFPRRPPAASDDVEAYLGAAGIDYRAPCDARATGLPDGSIDFVTSTNTLEHIPVDEIRQILAECARILSRDGAMSFQIDYQDHYSYFDARVSAYNFLRFDDAAWRRYNPSLHFQNRLRHRDYLGLFADAGLDLVAEQVTAGSSDDEALIRALGPAAPFRDMAVSDLAVRGSRVVLKQRR
jgi:hypothetical protein